MFRGDIELEQLHSRMASAENFTVFICSVVPEIGAEVALADTCLTCCRRRRKVIRVENRALWNTAERLLKLRFNFVTYGLGTVSIFFVTSSTTDFIRTEQGLHCNNIFVRNGFRSYLRVRRKFIFISIMSDWLIHRDSSSVEYNARRPSKLRLRNMAALCFVLHHTNPDGSSRLRRMS